MPNIPAEDLRKRKNLISSLDQERNQWRLLWRELSDFLLPSRYRWLLTDRERNARRARNEMILDSTGTKAARTLSAGMMNGVTSPSRPWFKLRIAGGLDIESKPVRMYLDEVERRMLTTMAETNFYLALQTMYLDLTVFGTSACLIYEDFDSVFRCYNPPLGEYYLWNSYRQSVDGFARKFTMKVGQVAERWPDQSYWSDFLKAAVKAGGARLNEDVEICHLIEPNQGALPGVRKDFRYAEMYWEANRSQETTGILLELRGYFELPGMFPRWDLMSGEAYGTSPAMDALGDIIQLQHETKKKAQALDKMVNPPIQAPIELEHRPTAMMPGGITYVSNASMKIEPLYTVNPPLGEISADIQAVQIRIRETFHNELFNMISQLDTVRSATEIDARREEKLVLLGGVLERFENEALDPAIKRIYGIMQRAQLLPEPPEELEGMTIEIQYVSILSAAQKAVGTIPTERLLQLVGNLAAVYPEVLDVPDPQTLVRDYAIDIGVKASGIRSAEQVQMRAQKREAESSAAKALEAGNSISQSAANLAKAEVGGGENALQQILGNM